jgi:hypothetical protein
VIEVLPEEYSTNISREDITARWELSGKQQDIMMQSWWDAGTSLQPYTPLNPRSYTNDLIEERENVPSDGLKTKRKTSLRVCSTTT